MITTHERIENPTAFIRSEPNLVSRLEPGDFIMVSGPDLAVGIHRPEPWEPEKSGVMTRQESALLGDLYVSGEAGNVRVLNKTYSVNWYPSAAAANKLGEELGLHPGKDMLRFTDAEYASVPAAAYLGYLARGEFPLATSDLPYFNHDRSSDHAIGILLMPPQLTSKLIASAGEQANARKQSKDHNEIFVQDFDYLSTRVGMISEAQTQAAAQGKRAPETALGLRFISDLKPYGYAHDGLRVNQNRMHAASVILDHIIELTPRIEVLKRQQAESATAVFKG